MVNSRLHSVNHPTPQQALQSLAENFPVPRHCGHCLCMLEIIQSFCFLRRWNRRPNVFDDPIVVTTARRIDSEASITTSPLCLGANRSLPKDRAQAFQNRFSLPRRSSTNWRADCTELTIKLSDGSQPPFHLCLC